MLTNIFIIVVIGLVTLNTLFILSACKISGRADAWEQEIIKNIKETSYIG